MLWEIEGTDEFGSWFAGLADEAQDRVAERVDMLESAGPSLGYPYSSDIRGSRHGRMRELRVQVKGEPYRILYAFDPRRSAILLLGGNKVGDDKWYVKNVSRADALYDEHLETLRREGLIDGKD
jgi:hypothetical protein